MKCKERHIVISKFVVVITALLLPSLLSATTNSKQFSSRVTEKLRERFTQIRDSLTTVTADSLATVPVDSLAAVPVDSLAALDTLPATPLTREERKELKAIERARRDSIRWSKPRVQESYLLTDLQKQERLIRWNVDSRFNDVTFIDPDTTFNHTFHDYPFMRRDVGSTYLGVSGSAEESHNYFKRQKITLFEQFNPYLSYSYTKENLPFYNVKSPETDFGYSGTLFANRDKEESNIKVMHTQNITPALNLNFTYLRYGGAGLLQREATDNRTVVFAANHLGKRYVMHAAYIYQGVKREENGGIYNDRLVLDTTLEESKDLQYRLRDAENQLKRNQLFLTHSYGIPIRWSKKDTMESGEGTITYFGHSLEFSTFSKKYRDRIELNDSIGRAFYHNNFYLSPTQSNDSIRLNLLENSLFIRIQPWAQDAIISKIDGGISFRHFNSYNFYPEHYLEGSSRENYNDLSLYWGVLGNYKEYLRWNFNGRFYLSGYQSGNLSLDGGVGLSFYPIPEGIHLTGTLSLDNRRVAPFAESFYSNHYQWSNDFNNITESKLQAKLEIPRYSLTVDVGYALIDNPIYYDITGVSSQHSGLISLLSASVEKRFKIGFLHLENRVLFQMSSNNEVIPIPEISANLRYYMQFQLVKNVLTAQFGADLMFNTKWYAPAYSPALGLFHNQNERKIGEYPYLDAFVNLQWKRTTIFVKYLNATKGWPNGDYFSAHHYLRPQSTVKFGLFWPFYIK